jgi:uncharacterized protein involved in cysteine biosynthesis
MALLSPAADLVRGFKTYIRGIGWLRDHPRYFGLLAVPWIVGLLWLAVSVTLLIVYASQWTTTLMFARPTDWPMLGLYYLSKAMLMLSALILALVGAALCVSVLAAPVYERISAAIEAERSGKVVAISGLRGNLRLLWLEGKKVALILVLSILLLLIPGLNVVSGLVAAFLAAWDLFDYPLARRGWPLRVRLQLARREVWALMGFSLWLAIPFAQILTLPLAVAGATLLNLDALARDKQLNLIHS